MDKPSLSRNKTRRKKMAINGRYSDIKQEPRSPEFDFGTEPSKSGSPYSFSSSRKTNTPERFSPGNVSDNKSISEGLHMTHSYSDFMRFLASKYNNSNENRNNNLMSLLDSCSSCNKKPVIGEKSFLNQSSAFTPLSVSSLPLRNSFTSSVSVLDENLGAGVEPSTYQKSRSIEKERKEEFLTTEKLKCAGLLQEIDVSPPLPVGFFTSSAMDMSSTRALLSIVRSASARNNTQAKLDTYFSDVITSADSSALSMKRTAETMELVSHTPLDLSSSTVKRPYVEPQANSFKRNQFRKQISSIISPAVKSDNLIKENECSSIEDQSSNFITDVITTCYTSCHPAEIRESRASEKISVDQHLTNCRLNCAEHPCSPTAVEVKEWSITNVVDFIRSIDICTEYAQVIYVSTYTLFLIDTTSTLCIIDSNRITSTEPPKSICTAKKRRKFKMSFTFTYFS